MNPDTRPSYKTYRPLLILVVAVFIHLYLSAIDFLFDVDTLQPNIRYYGYSAFVGGAFLFFLFSLTRKLFRDA